MWGSVETGRGLSQLASPTLHAHVCVLGQVDEYEAISWEAVLQGKLIANAYCVRKGLIRKSNFASHINRYGFEHARQRGAELWSRLRAAARCGPQSRCSGNAVHMRALCCTLMHVCACRYLEKRDDPVVRRSVPTTVVLNTWEAFQTSGDALWAHVDRFAQIQLCLSSGCSITVLAHACLHASSPSFSSPSLATDFKLPTPPLPRPRSRVFAGLDRSTALASCLVDAEDAIAAAAPGSLFILKPSLANKGAEVTVVGDYTSVLGTVKAWPDVREWVLQAYVPHSTGNVVCCARPTDVGASCSTPSSYMLYVAGTLRNPC